MNYVTDIRYRDRILDIGDVEHAHAAHELELELIQTKQSKCGMIQEGEGHWPNPSKNLQKARNLWVLRTPQNNKEEGARAKKKLVTCGTQA